MIPNTTLYSTSKISPAHSRADVEEFLEKFGVKNFFWERRDPTNSYLLFEKEFEGVKKPILYKVTIPFIEKETGPKHDKVKEYNEIRSYRIMFHVLKHNLLNTEVGMEFEQVFSSYMVVEKVGSMYYNLMDKISSRLISGKQPALISSED